MALWPVHEQAAANGSGVLVGASLGAATMLLSGVHTGERGWGGGGI